MPARRNRELHDALREFALEAAALLSDELNAGADLEFDVVDEALGRGPALYRYRPLTGRFIAERWPRLRELASCSRAADALGQGAAAYLRVRGLRGERAEPALQAMLERLYEDATGFGFPEERFERVYAEVEATLYEDAVRATVVSALRGMELESDRVDLGDGLSLVRGERADAPPEAVWPEGAESPAVLCALERDVAGDDPLLAIEAAERFRELVTGLRLFRSGGVTLAGTGWRRAAEGRWVAFDLGGAGAARGEPWPLTAADEPELRELLDALGRVHLEGATAWALSRFEMGCGRQLEAEALTDYLLALRALLGATTDAGRAGLPLRVAALCAEEGERRAAQRRVELALSLERFLMEGRTGDELATWIGAESPRALVEEMERHLRALLRDVVCGYLDQHLAGVADDILLESAPTEERPEIRIRDARAEREPAPEPAPVPEPEGQELQPVLEGVTGSDDWLDDDPDSYSAPI